MIYPCEFAYEECTHANTRGRCCTLLKSHSQVLELFRRYCLFTRTSSLVRAPVHPQTRLLLTRLQRFCCVALETSTTSRRSSSSVPWCLKQQMLICSVTCWLYLFLITVGPFLLHLLLPTRSRSDFVPLETKVAVMEGRCSWYILLYQPILGIAHGGIVSP